MYIPSSGRRGDQTLDQSFSQIRFGTTCTSGTQGAGGLEALENQLINALNSFSNSLSNLINELLPGQQCGCAPISAPEPEDCCHPCGSLDVDGNTITTPGGYKISVNGNCEWTITTPEGKTSKIWGDPHVAEGDGGSWDFHDNSVFVLPDGTKIYATTSGGDGATVTTGLTVSTGNEHVNVTGVNTGNPQVGNVTRGSFVPNGGFSVDDVYQMAGDGDDWVSWANGREVIGSEDHGKTQKFGDQLSPFSGNGSINDFLSFLLNSLSQFGGAFRPSIGINPFTGRPTWGDQGCHERNRFNSDLSQALRAMSQMFSTLIGILSLRATLNAGRNRRLQV